MDFRSDTPNPKRVAAGKLNRAKRGPLTAIGRRKLQIAIARVQPWRFATGPKTETGKLRSVMNGKRRQKGPQSVREIRKMQSELSDFLSKMIDARQSIE